MEGRQTRGGTAFRLGVSRCRREESHAPGEGAFLAGRRGYPCLIGKCVLCAACCCCCRLGDWTIHRKYFFTVLSIFFFLFFSLEGCSWEPRFWRRARWQGWHFPLETVSSVTLQIRRESHSPVPMLLAVCPRKGSTSLSSGHPTTL